MQNIIHTFRCQDILFCLCQIIFLKINVTDGIPYTTATLREVESRIKYSIVKFSILRSEHLFLRDALFRSWCNGCCFIDYSVYITHHHSELTPTDDRFFLEQAFLEPME